MDLSYSGCGFLGVYQLGAMDCLRRFIPMERINRVGGTSAGAATASFHLLGIPTSWCLELVLTVMRDFRSKPLGPFDGANKLAHRMPDEYDVLFPVDAHRSASKRLHICMTRLRDRSKVVVNEFETRQDLIDAINCSSFIPLFSGYRAPTYKGEKYIDGGVSDNLPTFDENTIRISPFAGGIEIEPDYNTASKPKLIIARNQPFYCTMANIRRSGRALWPMPATATLRYTLQGFQDAKLFLLRSDLIQCDSCYWAEFSRLPHSECDECSKLRQEARDSQLDQEARLKIDLFCALESS